MKDLDQKIKAERMILESVNKEIARLQNIKSYRNKKLKKLLQISLNQLCLEI
jgi:hypothetical protein